MLQKTPSANFRLRSRGTTKKKGSLLSYLYVHAVRPLHVYYWRVLRGEIPLAGGIYWPQSNGYLALERMTVATSLPCFEPRQSAKVNSARCSDVLLIPQTQCLSLKKKKKR